MTKGLLCSKIVHDSVSGAILFVFFLLCKFHVFFGEIFLTLSKFDGALIEEKFFRLEEALVYGIGAFLRH